MKIIAGGDLDFFPCSATAERSEATRRRIPLPDKNYKGELP
jgi:hypothetical protein